MSARIDRNPAFEVISARHVPVVALTIGSEERDGAVVTFTVNGALNIVYDRDGAEGEQVLNLTPEALDAISIWANRNYLLRTVVRE